VKRSDMALQQRAVGKQIQQENFVERESALVIGDTRGKFCRDIHGVIL